MIDTPNCAIVAGIVFWSMRDRDYGWTLPEHMPRPEVPADNPMSAEKVALGRRLRLADSLHLGVGGSLSLGRGGIRGLLSKLELLLDVVGQLGKHRQAARDVEAADHAGKRPLHAAARRWSPALVQQLLRGGAEVDASSAGPFVDAMRTAFSIFAALCAVGILASLARGRTDARSTD